MKMKTMHLFAGAGGGLLADLILGHEPVVAVEWKPYACQVLRERAAEGWFPGLCVYEGDVRLFDPSEYAGRVDSIHAGFPCQDISVAGAGAGITGERSGLWSEVVRITGAIRPQELFLENSPAITSRGLGAVLGDLASLGYDARWCVLGAAAVGAPHLRARWWCLARRADTNGMRKLQPKGSERKQRGRVGDLDSIVSDSTGRGRSVMRSAPGQAGYTDQLCKDVADSDVLNGDNGGLGAGKMGREQPKTTKIQGSIKGYWATEPDVGRVAHGVAARVHRLERLGNGQVPLQAATAYMILSHA